MTDYLVKRLREKRERCHDLSGVYYTEDMDCQTAAHRIEALTAEVARLTEQIGQASVRAEEAEDRAEAAEAKLAHIEAATPDYDCGLINDFGGGDVDWWQDYIRAEIGRANDHWRDAIRAMKGASHE